MDVYVNSQLQDHGCWMLHVSMPYEVQSINDFKKVFFLSMLARQDVNKNDNGYKGA